VDAVTCNRDYQLQQRRQLQLTFPKWLSETLLSHCVGDEIIRVPARLLSLSRGLYISFARTALGIRLLSTVFASSISSCGIDLFASVRDL